MNLSSVPTVTKNETHVLDINGERSYRHKCVIKFTNGKYEQHDYVDADGGDPSYTRKTLLVLNAQVLDYINKFEGKQDDNNSK